MDPFEATQHSKELSDYALSAFFPECVSVTEGKYITKSVQITKGDIVVLKSSDAKVVTLSYRDEINGHRKSVDISCDCPEKFMVLPPKESLSSRAASVIMYPSVSDLLIDSPTYFEATSSYDEQTFHGTSIHSGDRFRYRGIVVSPTDGHKRLKVLDEEGNIVFLSMDCRGNFYPLEDSNCYTLRELLSFAPVPRRLKLVEQSLQENFNAHSVDTPKSCSDPSIKDTITGKPKSSLPDRSTDISCLPQSLPFPVKGVLHMLKPEVSVTVSPLNDPDTVWTIPVTADILVQQYIMDDYEVPTAVTAKKSSIIPPEPLSVPEVEDIPNYPAPPTPQLSQPLIPIKVNSFLDIYGTSFPVKAKIIDMSECSSFYKTALSDCSDLTIHRVENTKILYAKDSKTDAIFSLPKDAKVSFLAYPQKFNVVSELVNLPVGTKIVVLEDIASDYPKTFSLQFGDVIRITSNVPALMKVKHTHLECNILKCERINDDNKGSVTKIKLPLDFDIKMMISTDHNAQKIITMQELLSGEVSVPSGDVAALIDSDKDNVLKNLPPNLKDLQILPEQFLIASVPDNSVKKSGEIQYKMIGISLNSGLVLAFRQRLKSTEADRFVSGMRLVQQEIEILTLDQYEDRKQICKLQMDEDKQDIESISSGDKYSVSGDSLQRTNSAGALETKKKNDKIRRLSRALNPKKWRSSKSAPDPLPHPEAMGLMALAVKPHYEKPNDYLIDMKSSVPKFLDQTWSSFGGSSDEESEKNIYEDVVIRPIREEPPPQRKVFSGPFHKSLPLPRRFAHSKARKEKAKSRAISRHSDMNNDGKPKARDLCTPFPQKIESRQLGQCGDDDEDDHIYECPDGAIGKDSSFSSSDLLQRNKINKHLSDTCKKDNPSHQDISHNSPSNYVQPLPEIKSTNTAKPAVETNIVEEKNSKNMPIESDENAHRLSYMTSCKKVSEEPPVPPRRTKKLDVEVSSRKSSIDERCLSTSDPFGVKMNDNTPSTEDVNKENSSTAGKNQDSDGDKLTGDSNVKPPVPKPRGVKKKRANSNLVDNSFDKGEESGLMHQKTKDSRPPVVPDKIGKNSVVQIPPAVLQPKPVREIVKPKPPPKPRLKP